MIWQKQIMHRDFYEFNFNAICEYKIKGVIKILELNFTNRQKYSTKAVVFNVYMDIKVTRYNNFIFFKDHSYHPNEILVSKGNVKNQVISVEDWQSVETDLTMCKILGALHSYFVFCH